MSTVLLGGASGFIGSRLARALRARGDRVIALTRRAAAEGVHWDPGRGQLDVPALAHAAPDIVINLAGETIAQRWTAERRRRILDSRVRGTEVLARAVGGLPVRPRAFLSGSAIGYYGFDRGDEELNEQSASGTGFLASVTHAWEHAALSAHDGGIRLVLLRTSTVLGAGGGALASLLPVFRLGAGGPVGSGRQWFSWIALEDMVRAILFLMDHGSASGPYNVASPMPVPYAEFATALGGALGRPALLPAPALALKAIFGQMATETILANQRVIPARLVAAGFDFRHPRIEEALRAEISRSGGGAGR